MTFLQSILLGLIQGVAEFLPISSSGHLAIAQNLLNINAEVPAFYDVLLHLGHAGGGVRGLLAGHLRYGAGIFLRHR